MLVSYATAFFFAFAIAPQHKPTNAFFRFRAFANASTWQLAAQAEAYATGSKSLYRWPPAGVFGLEFKVET
jgi:hypothetical protein